MATEIKVYVEKTIPTTTLESSVSATMEKRGTFYEIRMESGRQIVAGTFYEPSDVFKAVMMNTGKWLEPAKIKKYKFEDHDMTGRSVVMTLAQNYELVDR